MPFAGSPIALPGGVEGAAQPEADVGETGGGGGSGLVWGRPEARGFASARLVLGPLLGGAGSGVSALGAGVWGRLPALGSARRRCRLLAVGAAQNHNVQRSVEGLGRMRRNWG